MLNETFYAPQARSINEKLQIRRQLNCSTFASRQFKRNHAPTRRHLLLCNIVGRMTRQIGVANATYLFMFFQRLSYELRVRAVAFHPAEKSL